MAVTSPKQLGYKQQRGANGQFGRYGGEGNVNDLYYYVYNGKQTEPRKVTNERTGQTAYGKRGQAMVDTNIANAAVNSSRRRNRGTQGISLS